MRLLIFKMIAGAGVVAYLRFLGKANRRKQIAHVKDARLEVPMILLKLSLFVPLFLYALALFQATELLLPRDAVALVMSFVAVWLLAGAHGALGEFHTGAGYSLAETELVTDGLYAWIRHPIYAALALFSAAETLYVYGRFSNLTVGLVVLIGAANSAFCFSMARRESGVLVTMFGKDALRYQERVHAFLPLRKYQPPEKR